MKSTQITDCCGVYVLSEFGNTSIAIDTKKYPPEEITNFLKENINKYKTYGYSMLLTTLNHEQKEKIGHLFTENKFELVSKSYHPNHDSQIYVYIYKLNPKDE